MFTCGKYSGLLTLIKTNKKNLLNIKKFIIGHFNTIRYCKFINQLIPTRL